MSELKASARLRMMAKGAYSRGDVITADRLSMVAIDWKNKEEEIAALKTYISKGDDEIKSLDEQLATAKAEIAEYRRFMKDLLDNHELGDKLDFEMAALLAKHKESEWD